jgi:hypothetical protein
MVLNMSKINYMLYKHISGKYDSVPNFANISGISQRELNAVLLNDNITKEIASGIKICRFLNLDIKKLVLNGEAAEAGDESGGDPLVSEFHDQYIRLSAAEKKKVVDFMNSI